MPAESHASVGVEQLHRDAGRRVAVARGIDEVDAVETSRVPSARVALASVTLIHHVFDLWKDSLMSNGGKFCLQLFDTRT